MTISHAKPGDVIDVGPLGDKLPETKTQTLFKSDDVEVLRLILPAGKVIPEHKAPGAITVHCLEGEIAFTAFGKTQTLTNGQMLCLPKAEPHALTAAQNSSVLVTINRKQGTA